MKITTILLLSACLTASAGGIAQRVTLSANNAKLSKIFKEIKKQTGYVFFYDARILEEAKPVTVHVKNETVGDVLREILQGQPLDFSILQKTITIVPKKTNHSFRGFTNILNLAEQVPPVTPANVINGTVKDAQGNPLASVSVIVKGTTKGTSTSANGSFSIEANVGDVLEFTMVGFESQFITIKDDVSAITVVLKPSTSKLDQIIVIGYGTTMRKDFTGSVGSLDIENSPIAGASNINVLEALKGSISGLNIGPVNAAGGEPGVTIRGQNSINGSNTPLIVLDGVIYMGSLSSINVNNIATVDVLKDATSAAVYGSRSANGVIAITTKHGYVGKPLIQFNTSLGIQKWQNRPEMLRGDEWIKMVNDRNKYAEGSTNWMRAQELANREAGHETVWLDEVSRTGIMQNYQVAISGATENLNYYLSTSYDDNSSIIVGDRFNRIGLLGKLKANVTKWLEVGFDAGFAKRNYFGGAASLSAAQMMSPYGVMYRDDQGHLEKYPYTESAINPLWGVDDGTRDREEVRHDYRLYMYALVKVPWVRGLSYRMNYRVNQDRIYFGNLYNESYYVKEGASPDRYDPVNIQGFLGSANGSIENRKSSSYVLDNIINYNRSFHNHNVDVTVVATRDFLNYENLVMTGSNFSDNGNTALGIKGLHKATVQQLNIDGYDRSNVGYLGRVNYSFGDRYYFTGSYRRDGASVFGVDNKWANFWATGLAWRITKEPFMQSFGSLNDMKVKLSWGQNGNQGIGPYSTLSSVATAVSAGQRYEFSNTPGRIYYGLYQASLGNSHLGWETTSSLNTGFESVWLDNRIFVDLDVYFSKTTNQIFTRNIPVMTGFSTMITSLGQVNNTGLETTLRSVNIRKPNLNWSTSVTFWKNFNKLVSLYGEDLDGDGKEDDDISNNLFIGKSLGAIYGYEQIGIVQKDDTAYTRLTGSVPGAPKYRDIDGKSGITAADRKILGYTKANFRLNFSSNLRYKNFNLYVMVTGTFGGNNFFLLSNTPAYMTSGTGRPADNTHYIPYWTSENSSNVYPSATFAGDGRFLGLQNRAFVRVQDVTLSYTFNQTLLDRARLKSLKVFATAKNPVMVTNWVGGDPEVGIRMRENGLPVASTYSLGINMNF